MTAAHEHTATDMLIMDQLVIDLLRGTYIVYVFNEYLINIFHES